MDFHGYSDGCQSIAKGEREDQVEVRKLEMKMMAVRDKT